jgi:hypothetical protein
VDFDKDQIPNDLAPIRRPHISKAYRSTSSGEFVVALSVPVFAQEPSVENPQPDVIGVLARTLFLSQLLQDYAEALQAQGNVEGRKLALVDHRTSSLLAHDWMTSEHLKDIEDPTQQLRLQPPITVVAAAPGQQPELPRDRRDNYRDPVARFDPQHYGGDWLAAFSPVGNTGWIAVVQEPRNPVLRPVEALRERLLWTGAGGMLVVSVLVAGAWWLILAPLGETRSRWWPFRVTRRWFGSTLLTSRTSDSG